MKYLHLTKINTTNPLLLAGLFSFFMFFSMMPYTYAVAPCVNGVDGDGNPYPPCQVSVSIAASSSNAVYGATVNFIATAVTVENWPWSSLSTYQVWGVDDNGTIIWYDDQTDIRYNMNKSYTSSPFANGTTFWVYGDNAAMGTEDQKSTYVSMSPHVDVKFSQ
jgi:hypothetical protein